MKKIDPTVPHPDFPTLAEHYDLCEDAFEGEVCEYVPRLSGQSEEQWKAYVNRTAYFNMVDKTTYALVGALTRKPYVLDGLSEFPQTEYNNGTNFLQACYRDLLLGARVAIQVDVGADGKSQIVSYDADDIINWRGNGTEPGHFVVIEQEDQTPDPENPFATIEVKSWRELYIDDMGFYGVRVWRKDGKNNFSAEELPPMLVNGTRLTYIPLWVANPYDNTWGVYNPPLYTQAKINIEHFKKATDISHYEHYMALPTFTIVGDLATYTDATGNQSQAKVLIGSTEQALHLTQGSSAEYVEVSGSSHKTLMESLTALEEKLFVAGSRLLSSKKGVESAEALQLRSGSESAVLDTLVHSLEGAMNPAIALCGEIDRSGDASIMLNKDFTALQLDPALIKSLLELYTAGTITIDQLLSELYSGEVIKETP